MDDLLKTHAALKIQAIRLANSVEPLLSMASLLQEYRQLSSRLVTLTDALKEKIEANDDKNTDLTAGSVPAKAPARPEESDRQSIGDGRAEPPAQRRTGLERAAGGMP